MARSAERASVRFGRASPLGEATSGNRHGPTIQHERHLSGGGNDAGAAADQRRCAQEPIRIGAFLSVTGPASFLGDPELKTLELYIERLNAAGGVLGRKLQLVAYDDAGDAEKARTFAKRLIEQDKVDVIVGGSTTGTTMAVVPLAEAAQIPFISLAGAVVIVEPVKKWVFKTPHTDRMACEKIFVDMQARGVDQARADLGRRRLRQVDARRVPEGRRKHGIEIVADETYGAGDTDMTAQLTKIKNTAGVQAVLNAGFGQGPAIVTKNYQQLGLTCRCTSRTAWRPRSSSSSPARRPKACGCRPRRCWWPSLPAADAQKPVVVTALQARLRGRSTSSEISTFGGHAYDGLMLVVEAIKNAPARTDKAKVRDALEARGYVGTGGVVNMSATDHMGLDLTAFRMLEVQNGNWALVK